MNITFGKYANISEALIASEQF